jgi:shikimate kinase
VNLFLIGYRCSGKSTVGRALADRIGWPFVDTDQVIAQALDTPIARIVAEKGWPWFRQKEHLTLQQVAAGDGQVVATGGGVILDARNVSAMRASGAVVWLTAGEPVIRARLLADAATDGSRPALTDQGLIAEIGAVLAERSPLYLAAADLTVDTDKLTIRSICDRINAFMIAHQNQQTQ